MGRSFLDKKCRWCRQELKSGTLTQHMELCPVLSARLSFLRGLRAAVKQAEGAAMRSLTFDEIRAICDRARQSLPA